ncbi:peptidoglycan DD-metalloendopeptidase family protein [Actinacidiphila reveromycinica]|nr:peptidoglycan DD-metalloendopeptidase family protein [Streptomyces sp. SN-593]
MAYTAAWLTVVAVAVLAAGGSAAAGTEGGRARGGGGGPAVRVRGADRAVDLLASPAVDRLGDRGGGAPGGMAGGGVPGGGGPAVRAGCTGPPGDAARCWPVTGPGARGRPLVLRAFEPPATPWAAGHRGVDLPARPGTAVRAAAAGEVAFAGPVAGVPVVVVALPGGLRTTFEPVRPAVAVGTRVAAGERIGEMAAGAPPHCPAACVHWGLLRGEVYLDPLTLLPPALRRAGPSRLLPVEGVPFPEGGTVTAG